MLVSIYTLILFRSWRYLYAVYLLCARSPLMENVLIPTGSWENDKTLVHAGVECGDCFAVAGSLVLNSFPSCWSVLERDTCLFPSLWTRPSVKSRRHKCILPTAVFFLGTIHFYEDNRGFVPLKRDLALSIGIKNKSLLVLLLQYYILPGRLPIISLITPC